MQEMVKNLLAAMGDTIRGLDWMGPETKEKALAKLATFNPKVGYPDRWKDYSSVAITPGSYFANVVPARSSARGRPRADRQAVDRGRWHDAADRTAYYNPCSTRSSSRGSCRRQRSRERHRRRKLRRHRVVIGHEISHGSTTRGARVDAPGRLTEWWTEGDLKRFEERTCVVNKFESYFIEPGIHHNASRPRRIDRRPRRAKIAYLGLQKAQAKTPGRTIDGWTPDQQFFIAWGQFRGDEIRPEAQRVMVQGDPHPTGKYRVIGPLSNMPEFAAAFGCKQDALMVRPKEKRCEVW